MKQLPKDNAFKIIKKSITKQQVVPTSNSTASATGSESQGFLNGCSCSRYITPSRGVRKTPNSDNFLPEANFGLGILSLPAFVCVCVRVSVCQPRGWQRDNFWPIHPKVTKFRPAVQNTLPKIPIVSGGGGGGGGQLTTNFKVKLQSPNLPHSELARAISPYQLVFPKPLTRPFVLKYVTLLGFANQASLPSPRLPWESHTSEHSLFSPVVSQWLCNQMQSAWDVAAVRLLTF